MIENQTLSSSESTAWATLPPGQGVNGGRPALAQHPGRATALGIWDPG